jgi:hypothetical protein
MFDTNAYILIGHISPDRKKSHLQKKETKDKQPKVCFVQFL